MECCPWCTERRCQRAKKVPAGKEGPGGNRSGGGEKLLVDVLLRQAACQCCGLRTASTGRSSLAGPVAGLEACPPGPERPFRAKRHRRVPPPQRTREAPRRGWRMQFGGCTSSKKSGHSQTRLIRQGGLAALSGPPKSAAAATAALLSTVRVQPAGRKPSRQKTAFPRPRRAQAARLQGPASVPQDPKPLGTASPTKRAHLVR